MLTHAARGAMPVAPLFLVRAHTPGTGKSYLIDLVTAIVTGKRYCAVIAAGATAEETEKRLGALLYEGTTIIALDNCSYDLGGDALCQLAERSMVRIRKLGHSEAPEFENKAVITATGNNISPKDDLVRRTLTCNLVADRERPELRRFERDPVADVLANRGAYLAACLTIVRAYQAAGSPDVCGPIGSYGEWSAVARAPLIWLGEADPLDNMEAARNEDPVLVGIGELFAFWQGHLQTAQPCSAFEVREIAAEREPGTDTLKRPEFYDLLLRVAGERGLVSTRKLGGWLKKIVGRIVDKQRLVIAEASDASAKRAPKFRLESVAKTQDDQPGLDLLS